MRARVAAAFAWGALAGAASYALQRLFALSGEVPYAAIAAQAHVPYTWRVLVVLLHGVAVGLLVGFGLDEARADGSLAWVPRAIPAVLLLAAAMAIFP